MSPGMGCGDEEVTMNRFLSPKWAQNDVITPGGRPLKNIFFIFVFF